MRPPSGENTALLTAPVYAGLLPALRRACDRFWNVLTLRPGTEPPGARLRSS
jgi:hypothetical protein